MDFIVSRWYEIVNQAFSILFIHLTDIFSGVRLFKTKLDKIEDLEQMNYMIHHIVIYIVKIYFMPCFRPHPSDSVFLIEQKIIG